jgi:lipoate---protein ligase
MLCILSTNNDVFFNLASEEYFLKNVDDDVIMIWRSNPSVVIGKHQNTFAEINHEYVRKNNILVARRLTGGGTVFHDEGNLNFTFIKNGHEGKLVDFKYFISPIVEFLVSLGVKANVGSKNDILIDNLKISGNAEHIHKLRVLHHGTLLFNSDLNKLNQAIKVNTGKYIDKAVQSNRSKVTNIYNHLFGKISMDDFVESLFNFLLNKFHGTVVNISGNLDKKAIAKLKDEKYSTWEWIYGYSPPFSLESKISINERDYHFEIKVEKGVMSEIKANFSYPGDCFKKDIENLKGLKFVYSEIADRLENSQLDRHTKKLFLKELF